MRRILLFFVFFALLLTACQPALTATPVPAASTASQTATLAPSATPTLTSLPPVPTFTPTFDARTIVTATPAPKAECPKENPEIVLGFPYCDARGCSGEPYNDAILSYLNSGGALDELERKHWGEIADLTGDGLKEMVYSELGKLFIYGCRDDKYKTLYEFEGTQNTPYLDAIIDLNGNGMPELIVSNYERRAFSSIHIFEWNGNEFRSMVENKVTMYTGQISIYDWLGGTVFDYKITDINKDGIKEIVAVDKIPYDLGDLASGLPWRDSTITIGWNGQHFVTKQEEYTLPQYRFQAIQDADRLTLEQDYGKALQLYQSAIFSDGLDWWSKDRKFYESKTTLDTWLQNAGGGYFVETATPFPTLPVVALDFAEFPRLAAYAYYRMVILHTHLGEADAAQIKYATLQEKFLAGSPGHPYAEMASAFWDAYQSTGQMYVACGAAIAYVDAHPETLVPLGSDYHGWQSHTYVPADVCPFR